VALTWTASVGATSYSVYRGTAAGAEGATPIVTGITTAAYTNTGLTNGTTYYYEVAAVNTAGASSMSNEAAATPATIGACVSDVQSTINQALGIGAAANDLNHDGVVNAVDIQMAINAMMGQTCSG
jgi:hypothetical protein